MAANKAGGNSKKIGRNANKPWKKRYEHTNALERNRRLAQERHKRQVERAAKKWAKRVKKHKPERGHARELRRIGKQRVVAMAA